VRLEADVPSVKPSALLWRWLGHINNVVGQDEPLASALDYHTATLWTLARVVGCAMTLPVVLADRAIPIHTFLRMTSQRLNLRAPHTNQFALAAPAPRYPGCVVDRRSHPNSRTSRGMCCLQPRGSSSGRTRSVVQSPSTYSNQNGAESQAPKAVAQPHPLGHKCKSKSDRTPYTQHPARSRTTS
jgi:hypothetical protein